MENDSSISVLRPRAALVDELCQSPELIETDESSAHAGGTTDAEEFVRSDTAGNEIEPSYPAPMLDLMRVKSGIAVCRTELADAPASLGSSSRICHTETDHPLPKLPIGLYETLLLPTYAMPYKNTRTLFDAIRSLMIEHLRASEPDASLLAYWSVASWFPDFLDFIPRLTITGPPLAADLVLRILSVVCRHPVLLATLNPAAWRSIPFDKFEPTLFVRRVSSSKRSIELLSAVDAKGYFVASGRDLLACYGAVCVYAGEESKDGQLHSGGIHFHVQNDIAPTEPFPTVKRRQELQNQLFRYRFLQREQVRPSQFPVEGLLPDLCRVAQQLGAAILDDIELRNEIIEALRPRDEQARADRAFCQNGRLLQALLSICHMEGKQEILVREIAGKTNDFYAADGEPITITNERAGHILKNLGFSTSRLGSRGRGLRLDNNTRRRVHHLAAANEVLAPDPDGIPCGFCHQAQFSGRY